jgi:ParB/RepB/Spo0J family partition protein
MLRRVKLDKLSVSGYQPRLSRDVEAYRSLKESMGSIGQLVPLLVRPHPSRLDCYEVLDGGRRLDVARELGWEEIDVNVRVLSDREAACVSLAANMERSDLSALDQAHSFLRLVDEFGITQEEIAGLLNVSQGQVGNTLRLLGLDPFCQSAVVAELVSRGQALGVLGLPPRWSRWRLCDLCIDWDLTVKEIRENLGYLDSGAPFLEWVRRVPAEGLYEGLNSGSWKSRESDPIICLPSGQLLSGGLAVQAARDMGMSEVEATIVYPEELLREPLPVKSRMVQGGGSIGARSSIVPKLDEVKAAKMRRFLELMKGMEAMYPIVCLSSPLDDGVKTLTPQP